MNTINAIGSTAQSTGRSLAHSMDVSTAVREAPFGNIPSPFAAVLGSAGKTNQRQHKRYQLATGITCWIGLLSADVEDVSLVGLGIRAPSPLRIGQNYSITIRKEGLTLLSFPVVVSRSYLVGFETTGKDRPPIYRIGLDFQAALDEHAGEILAFLLENVVIHRPTIVAIIGVEGESLECPVENLSSREVELMASGIGPDGTRVFLSLHQGTRSVGAEAIISSHRPGALGGSMLSLRPTSFDPAARFDVLELIQQELV